MANQTETTLRPVTNHRRRGPHQLGKHSMGIRIVRLPEVQELTGLSRTTIWRRVQDGSFPPPIRLSGKGTRAMGWREQDIYNWINGLSHAA